jgi:hypothetical protein
MVECKKCINCNNIKSLDDFPNSKTSKDGHTNVCKKCISDRCKKWYIDNIERSKECKKSYYENNKEKLNNYKNEWFKEKMKSDSVFRLKIRTRNTIKDSFRGTKFDKKSKTRDILGCSFQEFRIYLEKYFEPWMNYENYGKYNGEFNYGWDIDHIIPTSSAKTEEEIIKLNHYTNLMPLCSKINRDLKKNKTNYDPNMSI